MTFYIEDKKFEYTDEQMESILLSDEGTEGKVYEIGNRAVKIYYDYCKKDRLTESDVNNLKIIDTNRIKLPKERVFNQNKDFNGYTRELIRIQNKDCYFRYLTMRQLHEEIKIYEEEVKKISDIGYLLYDMTIFNVEVSDGIYFIDPGSFSKNEIFTNIDFYNNEELKRFFICQIMARFSKLSKKDINRLTEYFNYDTYLSSMLEGESFDGSEKMSHFVRKLVNKR